MSTPLRPRRDFAALEARRMQAAQLFQQGHPQAEIVRRLHVSRPTAHRWYQALAAEGATGFARGGTGRTQAASGRSRPPASGSRSAGGGPAAWGFPTHLWTLPRVATVIWKTCRVHYHPHHVWRVLRSLGWTRQRPARRARERDEAAIARWVRGRWPRVKKTPRAERLAGVCRRVGLLPASSDPPPGRPRDVLR